MEGLSFTLPAADNLLVTGPAGAGKTSLFRAVRALWPLPAGRIALPAQGELLYLPQVKGARLSLAHPLFHTKCDGH